MISTSEAELFVYKVDRNVACLPENVAVIQPLPGIGDMVWHLRHIAAIARKTTRGTVTLVAKPSSLADQFMAGSPAIRDVFWLERRLRRGLSRHDGPGGLLRLIADLRAARFDAAILLHHSQTLAFTLCCAGVPQRYGYGGRAQRPFLNRPPFLAPTDLRLHPRRQADIYLTSAGWQAEGHEPVFRVATQADEAVTRRLAARPGPLVAIGVGASEAFKQWGEDNFATLIGALEAAGWPTIAVVGGAAERAMLQRLSARFRCVIPVESWHLGEVGALLRRADFYIGNDTGALNLAAAVGCRIYGLFGGSAVFTSGSTFVPILPPDRLPNPVNGMARITVQAVLGEITADRGGIGPMPPPR